MGLFDIINRNFPNLDTLDGINSIPVPSHNSQLYYDLQRKATEHKKNGNLELAIACLRKSNELSDYEERPKLLEKEYLRLVKYIKLTGDNKLANEEEVKIYSRHPEFKDKRISNKKHLDETLSKAKLYNIDLISVSSNNHCPLCKNVNHKTFSITGKTSKYPVLPDKLREEGGYCQNCIIGFSIKFDS